MTKVNNASIEAKKKILEAEMLQEILNEEKKWVETGLEGSGEYLRSIGLIKAKYARKIEAVESEEMYKQKSSTQLLPSPEANLQGLVAIFMSKNKKYKPHLKMAKLFLAKKGRVHNYLLVRCVRKQKRISKHNYLISTKENRQKFNGQIENSFRVLKKFWKPLGWTVSLSSEYSELIKLK